MPIIRRLGDLINDLKKTLGRLRRSESGNAGPHEPGRPGPNDLGFDPAMQHGPLGDAFQPGVNDRANEFDADERAIADRLAEDGQMVHQRPADHTIDSQKNPDAMVRTGPSDPGAVTEFKSLDPQGTNRSSAVRRNILDASGQAGAVVIDGRQVALSEADARRGYARAAGQASKHGQTLAGTVRIILGDNTIISLP
jgi:hypothetical protein